MSRNILVNFKSDDFIKNASVMCESFNLANADILLYGLCRREWYVV